MVRKMKLLTPKQLAEIREHYKNRCAELLEKGLTPADCDDDLEMIGQLSGHIAALESENTKDRIELCVLNKDGKALGEYPVVWLGRGNTIVSDVCGDDWAGVVVSATEKHMGIGEEFSGKLNPIVVIASKDPRSFEVVIGKCQIALDELLSKEQES